MNVSFLSHSLSEKTPSYGNRDSIKLIPQNSIARGDTANTTTIRISNNHIGTHIDVPKHFYDNGKTITDIPAELWCFSKIALIDVPCEKAKMIGLEDFENRDIHKNTDFILIRTGFEQQRMEPSYWNGYPGISPDLCEFLRSEYLQLRAIGFDFISLTSPLFKEEGKAAHRVLLEERMGEFVFILEDMKLAHLKKVPSKLVVAPLLLQNGNGGPVSVFAFS